MFDVYISSLSGELDYRREPDAQEGDYQNAVTSNYPWTENIITMVAHKQIIWIEDSNKQLLQKL